MENITSDQKKDRNRKKMYNWTSVSSVSLTPAEELTLLAKNNTGLCRYIEYVRKVDFLIFSFIYFIIFSFPDYWTEQKTSHSGGDFGGVQS